MRLAPVALSTDDVELFYEGFSNDTIWPLYHDVISPPAYHREWWDAYVRVNERFAAAAAEHAQIARAVAAGNAELARAATLVHLDRALTAILRAVRRLERRPAPTPVDVHPLGAADPEIERT